jgi:predicted HicB family RNase H-like nuclease
MPLHNDPELGPLGPWWRFRHASFRTTWKETIAVLTQSTEKYQQILQSARQLFESEPDWVTFFREILGVDGVVRRQFTRLEDLTAFEKSQEFEQIQKWLVKLREQKNATDTESEPTRVITVRLPKSMHEYLRTEAHDLRTSMNKLCISKLLQVIEQDLIPTERSSGAPSRVNKPAPQPATAGIGGSHSSPAGHSTHTAHSQHSHSPISSSQPVFRSASGF